MTPARSPRIGALAIAARHPVGLAALGAMAVAGAAVLAMTGAAARADVPPASAGRVMKVVYQVRRAPDPPAPATYSLLPTVEADAAPPPLDPALESVQAVQAVRAYDVAQARESGDLDAMTRRAFASADAEPAATQTAPLPSPSA